MKTKEILIDGVNMIDYLCGRLDKNEKETVDIERLKADVSITKQINVHLNYKLNVEKFEHKKILEELKYSMNKV